MIAVNASYIYQGVHLRVSGSFDPSVPTWRDVRIIDPDTEREVVLPEEQKILAVDKLSQAAGVVERGHLVEREPEFVEPFNTMAPDFVAAVAAGLREREKDIRDDVLGSL